MDVFKVRVVDIDKCTICMACELRCPDFAIFVEKK
jgi:2-oxoglutarate ferredoxin oxidoreductase subunit delta